VEAMKLFIEVNIADIIWALADLIRAAAVAAWVVHVILT